MFDDQIWWWIFVDINSWLWLDPRSARACWVSEAAPRGARYGRGMLSSLRLPWFEQFETSHMENFRSVCSETFQIFKISQFLLNIWKWWWNMSFSSATTSNDRGLSSSCFSFPPNFTLRASPSFATRDAWWGRCGPALPIQPIQPILQQCWGVRPISDTPNS